MTTKVENEPRVQLGTTIKLSNSVWLAQHRAELKGQGVKTSIAELVDEAIERMRKAEGGQVKLGF